MNPRSLNQDIITLTCHDEIHLCGVYKIYHTSFPEKIYVGSTSNNSGRKGKVGFARRFQGHRQFLRSGKHPSKELVAIVSEYGLGGLFMEIIEICEPGICREREQFYINNLNPILNIIPNAKDSTGYKHTQDSLSKMSRARLGKSMPEEVKAKISATTKGRTPNNISILRDPEINKKRIESIREFHRNKKEEGYSVSRLKEKA